MPASASRVLGLALASRVAMLACMLLCDWAFRDLDTSARLQGFPCASGVGDSEAGEEQHLGTAGECVLAAKHLARVLITISVQQSVYAGNHSLGSLSPRPAVLPLPPPATYYPAVSQLQ